MLIRKIFNWLYSKKICIHKFLPIRSEYWTKGIGFYAVDEHDRKLMKCTKCCEVRYEK